jgi:hypothetical protein
LKLGVLKEIIPGERRVALIPDSVQQLTKKGAQVLVETGAGLEASFLDEAYENAGATIVPGAADVYAQADVVCKVARPVMNEALGKHELDMLRPRLDNLLFASRQPRHRPQTGGGARDKLQHGRDPAHHSRPEHGRALFDEHGGGLQGGAVGGR